MKATALVCHRPGGLELTERLLAAAGLTRGAEVLDVGCGSGATVVHLGDEHGLRATGLDSSPARIEEAREARPELDFVAGRAESLPFVAGSFDAVLCECVLSTLEDPGVALAEMARVLRPGAAALISDVYLQGGSDTPDGRAPAGGPRPLARTKRRALGDREAIEELLVGAGLVVKVWEDQSGALGRYLWDRAARTPAPQAPRRRASSPAGRPAPSPSGSQLGYFICLACPSGVHERSRP